MKKAVFLCYILCFIVSLIGCSAPESIDEWLSAPVLETNGTKVIYRGNSYDVWDYNSNDYNIPVLTNELENANKRLIGRDVLFGSYYIVFEEEFGDAVLFYSQYSQWFLKEGYELPDPFSLNLTSISIVKGTNNLLSIKKTSTEAYTLYDFVDSENALPFGCGEVFNDTGFSIEFQISEYQNLKIKDKFIFEKDGNLYFSVLAHEKMYKIRDDYQNDILNVINK